MARDRLISARRGVLLRTLAANYPHPLADLAFGLQTRVLYLGPAEKADQERPRDLAYLVERGLIRREESKVGAAVIVTWYLTAEGLFVVEGATTDPGVEIAGG